MTDALCRASSFRGIAFLYFVATLAAACRESPTDPDSVPAEIMVEAIDTLRSIGATATLTATVRNASHEPISGMKVSWESSDPAVVTVDQTTGRTTAVANGEAIITARAAALTGSTRAIVRQRVDMTKSTISVALPLLLVGDTVRVTLKVRDALDNPVLVNEADIGLQSGGSSVLTPGQTADRGGGTFTRDFVAVAVGMPRAFTATIDGKALAIADVPTLQVVGFTKIGVVSGTYAMSCGIITTGDMYCWGSREQGVRGTGVPLANVSGTTPTLVAGSRQWTALDLALAAVCGITADAKLYCWGDATGGALANGQTGGIVSTPGISLKDSTIMSVDLGGISGGCALTTGHRALCWGGGTWGRLGNGADTAVVSPVFVNGGHRFAAIASSFSGACGVTDAGAAWCWGSYGTLGIGSGPYPDNCRIGSACSKNPVLVAGGLTFKPSIARGGNDVCALTTSNKTYCWGRFNYTPMEKVGAPAFTKIDSGEFDFCGIAPNGTIYCWGNNSSGRMQQPPDVRVEVNNPVAVTSGGVFTDLSMHSGHMCAIEDNGNAWCWGQNTGGQLGDRTLTSSFTPVRVRLFVP